MLLASSIQISIGFSYIYYWLILWAQFAFHLVLYVTFPTVPPSLQARQSLLEHPGVARGLDFYNNSDLPPISTILNLTPSSDSLSATSFRMEASSPFGVEGTMIAALKPPLDDHPCFLLLSSACQLL